MLSVRFHDFGNPAEVLRAEQVEQPEPRSDQVLVRLRARSINPSDLLTIRGMYGVLPSLPATPGLEGMGEIVTVGSDVQELTAGQRVVPNGVPGTWQEMTVAKASQLIPIPDDITDQSAAQLVVNPLSAWIMVVEQLAVQPGEWLVQTAASSTLGRIVLQLARMTGFRTINVVRSRERIDELMALGADEVVCTEDGDVTTRIRTIVGTEPVTKAIDAVGGEVGAGVLRALAPGGTMILFGALSRKPLPVDGTSLIYSAASIQGFWLNRWRRDAPIEQRQRVIRNVVGAMAAGSIVPPVEEEYALADFAAAITHAGRSGRRGKILLIG